MSGRGNCYEYANAEAVFSTLKTECFPAIQLLATKVEARRETFQYIEASAQWCVQWPVLFRTDYLCSWLHGVV